MVNRHTIQAKLCRDVAKSYREREASERDQARRALWARLAAKWEARADALEGGDHDKV